MNANGTSVIAITFRNSQNQFGDLFSEHRWQTYFDTETNFRGLGMTTEGRVRTLSSSPGAPLAYPDFWVVFEGYDANGRDKYGLRMTSGNGGPIMGCFKGEPVFDLGGDYSYYSICGQAGFGGTVTILWNFVGRLTLNEIYDIVDTGNEQSICAAAGPRCHYTVAPEPATWTLVGTGLLFVGIGGLRRAKRRRGE